MNDGGPAFPVDYERKLSVTEQTIESQHYPGMSLRDYFAAKAMQGVISNLTSLNKDGDVVTRQGNMSIVEFAYFCADAMLAHRTNPQVKFHEKAP